MRDVTAETETEITACLSTAPHILGRRLKSELQLCGLFGLGRWQMRVVLDRLVQDGVITRRRGSGTFVKRIPKQPSGLPSKGRVDVDQLLATEEESESSSAVPRYRASKRLELALWSDWSQSNRSLQAILAGMVEHANRCNHTLAAHSMLLPDGEGKGAAEVIAAVNASRCDGAIFGYNFYVQHPDAFATCRKPIALYYPGALTFCDRPSVSLDIESATARAVKELALQGYKRIALLGLKTPYHDATVEESAFTQGVRNEGLSATGFFTCDYQNVRSCIEATQALLRSEADSVFVTDDVVLAIVSETLRSIKSRIGRDFGVITLANRGVNIPDWCAWSKVEVDGWLFGRMIVETLAMHIESGQMRSPLLQVRLNWVSGSSHRRNP